MIRKLTEKDRQVTLDFLGKEASINLFIIGDIEGYGFDSDIQDLWGQFNDDQLIGILLRFNESYIPYYDTQSYPDDSFEINEFLTIMKAHLGQMIISGKETIIKRFEAHFNNFTVKTLYFCELSDQKQFKPSTLKSKVYLALPDDANRIYELIETIEEFAGIGNRADRIKSKIVDKTGRVYYIEDKGKMISLSQTTAENSMSAMIVGVATLKDYRGQGLMSGCLSTLCRDLLEENKTLCLFYDNPKAGKVYHRLGFKTIDNWMMMTRK